MIHLPNHLEDKLRVQTVSEDFVHLSLVLNMTVKTPGQHKAQHGANRKDTR